VTTLPPISAKDLTISKFKSALECADFECEDVKYADFLKKMEEAETLQLENTSVTYLFRLQSEIVGYVTLALHSVRKEQLSEDLRKTHRFRDIPCLLLAQLARKSTYAGRGLGQIMVAWTIDTARKLSREAGCRYVIVDAEPHKKAHYEAYFGFKTLPQRKGDKTTLMYFDLGRRK
jgi:hypothetical protein